MQYAMTVQIGKLASYQRPPFTDLSAARKAEIGNYLRMARD